VAAIPSKNIPEVVTRLTGRYVQDRKNGESFREFVKRIGKVELKKIFEDLAQPPADQTDHSFFKDWGDPREFSMGDHTVGECAGEVVSLLDFDLAAAERQLFEAQVAWEKGDADCAGKAAYQSMLRAARALVKAEHGDAGDDPDRIVAEFRARLYDTKKFFDPYAGGKFAHYLFAAHRKAGEAHTTDSARLLMDEAQLFIEASHSCSSRTETLVGV
jgi:hypothetical protein